MAKFTFKMHRETGLRAVAYRPNSDIKIKGVVVGSIREGTIRLMVKRERTEDDPAVFRWVTLKKRFSSDAEAREFLRGVGVEAVMRAHDLYVRKEED
jgi:hypothetical protein